MIGDMSASGLPWWVFYIITLFMFDISPGVSFVTVAKNTIKNKSLTIGLFTALGIATSDGISAIVGFFFCKTLNYYGKIFMYVQALGMCYLLYVGMKMMAAKPTVMKLEGSLSKAKFEAFKTGFLYTFSNFGIATIIITVISQFYNHVGTWKGYAGLLATVPAVSFATFAMIACACYFLKLWWLFSKYSGALDKIAGFVIICLAGTNLKSILGI